MKSEETTGDKEDDEEENDTFDFYPDHSFWAQSPEWNHIYPLSPIS